MEARSLLAALAILVASAACSDPVESDDGGGDTLADESGDGDSGDGDGDACVDPNLAVDTVSGPITGAIDDGVVEFLGIPYAAAPIDALRFRPPQPPEPWTEPRETTSFGPRCVQLIDDTSDETVGSEDCLQLNVWTPTACASAELPVLVFIHGGGNSIGSATEPLYDGRELADGEQVVVVTINYRLGALGWLALPELDDEDPDGVSGNYGLRDQIAALAWVQANIAGFGGDPDRVTVFGESAGAVNTCSVVGAPSADGLFAGAIVQSGTCTQPSRSTVELSGVELVESADCIGDVAECLRAIPAEQLIALEPTGYPSVAGLDGRGWSPHVDGVVLPQTTIDAMEAGSASEISFVIGSNRDETAMDTPPLDEATYTALIQATFSIFADEVLDAYPVADYPSPSAAFTALTSDLKFICSARDGAIASAHGGAPTWRYQFSYDAYTNPLGGMNSAFHGLELVFLFGNFETLIDGFVYTPNPGDLEIAASMQRIWAEFAATGVFEGPSYVVAADPADPYLELDVPISEGAGLRTVQCDFWDELLG